MNSKYGLSNTEKEIMDVLWEHQGIYTTKELLNLFNERGKEWKRQTLNTLIVRLETKGLVNRDGKKVYPIYTETEYKKLYSQELLYSMYDGKISNFIMALTGRKEISKEDEEELNNFIEDLK